MLCKLINSPLDFWAFILTKGVWNVHFLSSMKITNKFAAVYEKLLDIPKQHIDNNHPLYYKGSNGLINFKITTHF